MFFSTCRDIWVECSELLIYQRKLIVQPEITGDLKLLFVIDGLADATGDDGDRGMGAELTKSVFRINEMNRMGMIVDLSHVSKNVVIDVLGGSPEKGWNGSLAPPMFSHSFAYALFPHPHNVMDEVLRLVKEHGALVMINFVPDFVLRKAGNNKIRLPDPIPEGATMEKVVVHIRHVGQLIGYYYVGISADFAGVPSTPEGLDNASEGCRKEICSGCGRRLMSLLRNCRRRLRTISRIWQSLSSCRGSTTPWPLGELEDSTN